MIELKKKLNLIKILSQTMICLSEMENDDGARSALGYIRTSEGFLEKYLKGE